MIVVVQRVSRGEVRIAGRAPEGIAQGLLILLGVARGDDQEDARWLARKCLSLRIFNDAAGRMNRALEDVAGGLLVISQFTLLGDCSKGRRPSWGRAADPAEAERLYDLFVELLRRGPFPVATGVFQAKMDVESINDGPVTLIIDSCDRQARGEDQPRPREPARSGLALLRRERTPLWLASRSPRRVQLLEMLGVPFAVRFPCQDGRAWRAGEDPARYAQRQAETKALSVAPAISEGVVLGADTVVFLEGRVLEKPRDAGEAATFLRRLAGREHQVFTGLCLVRAGGGERACGCERSRVRMAPMDAGTIRDYVATGEPLDKAGAYGIQGVGGMFVESIDGCYFNVMGLPLARLRALFRELEEGQVRDAGGGGPR